MSRYGADLSFLHWSRTRLSFGAGALCELAGELSELGKRRALVVTDEGLRKNTPIVDQVCAALGDRLAGVFSDVQPDGRVSIVDAGAARAQELNADVLVSVGGGSAIDTAKAMAIVATLGGSVRDHQGFQNINQPLLSHVALPTTAGTGSEVTHHAVIFDEDAGQKLIFGDFFLAPDLALLDPELTLGLPPAITAGTGLDALTHAIEAMHSAQREPLADALALHAIALIREHLPIALETPDDLCARGQMMIAASMAGMAFANAQVGLVHAIAHAMGALRHVHHGTANAVLLPHVIRWNAEDEGAAQAYRAAGQSFGTSPGTDDPLAASLALADGIEALVAACGLPTRMRDAGIEADDLDQLAQLALSDASIVYNPRFAMDLALIRPLLDTAF